MVRSAGAGGGWNAGNCGGEGKCGGTCVLGGESGRRGEVEGRVVAVQCRAAGEVKAMAGAEGGKRVWLPQIQK